MAQFGEQIDEKTLLADQICVKIYLLSHKIERVDKNEEKAFVSAIFRKEDFIKVGGYNPNMKYGFEDWDFWLSIIEKDSDVYQIDKILFYYRIRNKSMVRSIDEKRSEYLRRQIWENHKELFSKYFFNPIESFEYQGMKKYLDSYNYKIKTKINKIVSFFKF